MVNVGELQSALGLFQAIPAVAPFAMGASVVASFLDSDPAAPIILLEDPFGEGNMLWGVPRNTWLDHFPPAPAPANGGPRNELSFHVEFSVAAAAGSAPGAAPGDSALLQPGFQELDLPNDLGLHAPWGQGSVKPTSQAPPYDIDAPYAISGLSKGEQHSLTVAEVLWSEALRRGSPRALLDYPIYLGRNATAAAAAFPRQILVHSIGVGAGEGWDPYVAGGAELSDALEQWLAGTQARRNAVSEPVFDDLDLRTWEAGGYADAYQAALADGREQYRGFASKASSWLAPTSSLAIAERDAWNARRDELLVEYSERKSLWSAWRFTVESRTQQEAAFAQQQAQYEAAWEAAVAEGHTFEQAAQIAAAALAQVGTPGAGGAISDGLGLAIAPGAPGAVAPPTSSPRSPTLEIIAAGLALGAALFL